MYDSLVRLEKQLGKPAIDIFDQAIKCNASLGGKTRRVGGATYQVPVEVRPERRNALAQRWIISRLEQDQVLLYQIDYMMNY